MEISVTDLMDCLREAEMLGRVAATSEYKATILMLEESNVTLQRANTRLYEEREQLTELVRQCGLGAV